MTSFVFNVAKGRVATYMDLDPVNSALIIVPLEFTGLETKTVLEDKATLAAVLSGSTNEETSLGRKTVTSTTISVDNTNNRYVAGIASQTWTAATGDPIGGFVVCYDPDTTTSTDSTRIPISYHDWNVTPAGSDLILNLGSFYIAL